MFYRFNFFANLSARLLHLCPGCSLSPNRDGHCLRSTSCCISYLVYMDEGKFQFIDTIPDAPAVESLRGIHVPVLEPKLKTFSSLGMLICHTLTPDDEPFSSSLGREIVMSLLDHKDKNYLAKMIRCVGVELLDLAYDCGVGEREKKPYQYDRKLFKVLLDAGGFKYYDYPAMRYPMHGYMMHRRMFDRYSSRMPWYFMDELGERTLHESSLEAAFICCKHQMELDLTPIELLRKLSRAKRIFLRGQAYATLKHFKTAEFLFTKCLAICPLIAKTQMSDYYVQRAICRLRLKKYMKAVHDCNRALVLNPVQYEKIMWLRFLTYYSHSLWYPAWVDGWTLNKPFFSSPPSHMDSYKEYLRNVENYLNLYKHNSPVSLFDND